MILKKIYVVSSTGISGFRSQQRKQEVLNKCLSIFMYIVVIVFAGTQRWQKTTGPISFKLSRKLYFSQKSACVKSYFEQLQKINPRFG